MSYTGSHVEADAMSQKWSYTSSRFNFDAMSQTWSYTGSHNIVNAMSQTWSYTGSHNIADAMSQTWSYTGSYNIADAMFQTWSYSSTHITQIVDPHHLNPLSELISQVDVMSQTWSYTDYPLVADACPRHVLHWLTSHGRCMSQTCFALALVSMPMLCPKHGLTLALIMWPMHVSDMSYTSSHTNDLNVMA
ncbi:Interferon-induced very large GTPase 1 [Gossypium arboreum]|uniref:Interferon-induced very large GTPase 1 n=1 Tax=Gossypium arboreum TaxID=29729 RepID=A0A0B0PRW8_GOSAR|nr:Interferon-induced very large GTPase 1 [Gossypium arboreum]